MTVTVEDAAYTRLMEEHIMLTNEPKEYSFAVSSDQAQTLDLKFQLGSIGDAAELGTHKVTLSNIIWNEWGTK